MTTSWAVRESSPERIVYAKDNIVAEVIIPERGVAYVKQIKSPTGIVKDIDEELQNILDDLNKDKTLSADKLKKDTNLLTSTEPVKEGSRLGKAHDPTKKVARLAKLIGSMRYS